MGSEKLILLTLFGVRLSANSKNLRKFTEAINLEESRMYLCIKSMDTIQPGKLLE